MPKLVTWQAKTPSAYHITTNTQTRKAAASLMVVHLTSFQLGHWVCLLAGQLAEGIPPQNLQGTLTNLALMADTMGYAL